MELTIAIAAAAALLILVVLGVLVSRWYKQVPAGSVLVVSSPQGMRVQRRGGLVLPVLHKAEVLDLGARTIEIQRCGKQGLLCRDNIRVDVTASFRFGVHDTEEDILRIARTIGVARANDPAVLRELFAPRLEEALRQVLREYNYEAALSLRSELRDRLLDILGKTIEGFEIQELALGALEVTALEHLDPNNILDAQGIQKITEIACAAKMITNKLQQELAVMVIKSRMDAEERAWEAKNAPAAPP